MGKKEDYRRALETILDDHAAVNLQLTNFLSSNSRLPGPRANLELLDAFSLAVGGRCRASPERYWNLSTQFSKSPYEFVAMCGVRGLGAMGAKLPILSEKALGALKTSASSQSWRVREAVAMGLQDMIEANSRIAKRLEEWVFDGDWLLMRAVAAGVAEPRLLRDEKVAATALQLHRAIIEKILRTEDRRSEGFRVLRQALGYSLSVVVAAIPELGFPYMVALVREADADIRWVCRENLKKDRLSSLNRAQVQELRALMG